MKLAERHKSILLRAVQAIHERTFFAQYPEHPSPEIYGHKADKEGKKWFEAMLGKHFDELRQAATDGWVGDEESPYWQKDLNINYPVVAVDDYVANAREAFDSWRQVGYEERAILLIESLEQMKSRFFEIAYATMHTTGQGFMMAFQESGPHAADRALEAIAMGYEEQRRFPVSAVWEKPMGQQQLTVAKAWRQVPRGISLVIGSATSPVWNSVPGIYASLVTGNPVIVKPHPGAVLPMAIWVAEMQKVLAEQGINPLTVQLAVDSPEKSIAKALAEDQAIKLIDYTGGPAFGTYLEQLPGKVVFAAKGGANAVIVDSASDVDTMVGNITFSVALYSGQMSTSPQNIFIPEKGIETAAGRVSFEALAAKFVEQFNSLIDNPKAAPFVLGAIQNRNTLDKVKEAKSLPGKVLLESRSFVNPMFSEARLATPVLIEVKARQLEVYSKAYSGPVAFLIKTKDTRESVKLARSLAETKGANTCAAYCVNEAMKDYIAEQMTLAAVPVSFNFRPGIYVNQHAGFSDYYVAGQNTVFTNPEFVVKRFYRVGVREPIDKSS